VTHGQSGFDIRCDWGLNGLRALLPSCQAVIIVDVLSFCTAVDVATARGVVVYPSDPESTSVSVPEGARLAGERSAGGLSLSPRSFLDITPGTRVVLPSPNGSRLSLATGDIPTFAGCLRNAEAVASAARQIANRIAVIPAGERWPDGSLRPAIEDWLGAGAILRHLDGAFSPEAWAARSTYLAVESDLKRILASCGSAVELIESGYACDVELACELSSSRAVPKLIDGGYRG
jgi:2-phosphosulfolactate phosphatase